ncbi:MAG: alpha-amylase family glycosyl hydrolase, partial [Pseudomonadota bacterium]|nr:alpha-amylase family glycosyl hydrolase [Pseudomonadota bacterium]
MYQIYPRSFMDANGDGIGDLPGITQRLDHVASLGVDAIWISPFFTSPMKDFGYDVSDYRDVDPIFGTLADFDALVARAHELGLKVLIDQVYSHTSDEHAWFVESRASRDNAKADWYVWADAKPDGTPPSNWQSVFGGPAWTWDARRGQYYLHNFLSCQPQLNGHNPDVQEALLGVARFWLDRGVDGFRIDALNFAMHDPQLRDNPPAPPTDRARTRPFDFQRKIHNMSHPDIPGFIERIRAVTDEYDAVFTVAEVGGDEAEAEMKAFTHGDTRLNSAYGFNFLYADRLTPGLVCAALAEWPEEDGIGWPSWAFENHDAPRAVSRWCAPEHRDAFARMKLLLLASLRGNIILYQGEELGLTQVDIPFEQLQDPEAIANWPLTLSRDGARTPMPWESEGEGGFGASTPWLPLGEENLARSVALQSADPASLLALTREVIALRKSSSALRHGNAACHADGALLQLERVSEGERI